MPHGWGADQFSFNSPNVARRPIEVNNIDATSLAGAVLHEGLNPDSSDRGMLAMSRWPRAGPDFVKSIPRPRHYWVGDLGGSCREAIQDLSHIWPQGH